MINNRHLVEGESGSTGAQGETGPTGTTGPSGFGFNTITCEINQTNVLTANGINAAIRHTGLKYLSNSQSLIIGSNTTGNLIICPTGPTGPTGSSGSLYIGGSGPTGTYGFSGVTGGVDTPYLRIRNIENTSSLTGYTGTNPLAFNRYLVANSVGQVNYNLGGYYPGTNYTETLTFVFISNSSTPGVSLWWSRNKYSGVFVQWYYLDPSN